MSTPTKKLLAPLALAALALTAACGGEDAARTPTSCGLSGAKTGAECAGLVDCGAGASNRLPVSFCEHCIPRADTAFCEAGTCRTFDPELTNVNFQISLPAAASAGKSFTIASLVPVTADGTTLTCAALLSTCMSTDNAALNARNSRTNQLPDNGGDVLQGLINMDPGAGRILFVQVTSELQGRGAVVAHGCTEGIEVVKGQSQTVALELTAL